jgi:fatty-acyl-CoA synthase
LDDVLLPIFEKFRSKTRFAHVIMTSFGACQASSEFLSYEDFLASGADDFHPADVDEDDAAAMCFTSGTTGPSKAVVYSHRALVLHSLTQALPDVMNLSTHSVVFPISPMFHANAWGMPWSCVMVGAKLILPGPHLDAESVLDTMEAEGVTHSCAVPTVWMGVEAALEKEPSRWKFPHPVTILCGGTAPPIALMRSLERSNLRLIHAWGMTETAPLATVASLKPKMMNWPQERQMEKRATQGMATPFVEIRIMRPEGKAPHDGQTAGEIEIRGPWIASSYFECSNQQHRWTADGWFKTGDIATMDADGYVKIVDRSKDLIKSGGEWINPKEMEDIVGNLPAVALVAVIARADKKWGERPALVVEPQRDHALSEQLILEALRGKVPDWWLPDQVLFVERMPLAATGKIDKRKLRAILAAPQ